MGETTFTLENWSIESSEDPGAYTAPETISMYGYGEVYGHPDFIDGSRVHTSRITQVIGNIIETCSGNKYLLGAVSDQYLQWLNHLNKDLAEGAKHHIPTDDEPIRVYGVKN